VPTLAPRISFALTYETVGLGSPLGVKTFQRLTADAERFFWPRYLPPPPPPFFPATQRDLVSESTPSFPVCMVFFPVVGPPSIGCFCLLTPPPESRVGFVWSAVFSYRTSCSGDRGFSFFHSGGEGLIVWLVLFLAETTGG